MWSVAVLPYKQTGVHEPANPEVARSIAYLSFDHEAALTRNYAIPILTILLYIELS